MNKKVLWITETAVLLALLVVLQWVTKPLGQIVTGSCVNAVLAVSALLVGLSSGLTVALVSPVCAYLLGIAPNLVAVPAIMAGNAMFVYGMKVLGGEQMWKKITAWLAAAIGKFVTLYVLVVVLICGPLSSSLLEAGLMKKHMIAVMTASFSWPQLVTALIGGALALFLVPILKKALRKN